MSKLPEGPWKEISLDFCGLFPSGEYLVITDDHGRFPEIEIL